MDLWLICRAESEALARGLVEGGRDWPLTDRGREQAARLAERLAHIRRIGVLYSSPSRSAWETAGYIGRTLGLAVRPEDDLREVNCGRLGGRPLEEARREAPGLFPPGSDIFSPFPEGESYAEMHVRVVRAVNRIVDEAGEEPVAVVTYPGPIHAFLLAFLRYAIEQRAELGLGCDPASLHHLRRGPEGRKEIVCLNDTAHLVAPGTIRKLSATGGHDALEQG
ncbi:MAG: histidine phosphatase family protein [Chloroflexia bacterium]